MFYIRLGVATKPSRFGPGALVWISSQGERGAFIRLPLAMTAERFDHN
jgi:hypothetical protein